MRLYKGFTIWEKNVHGMWTATNYSAGYSQLAADTLQGLKQLITKTIENNKR